MRSPILLLVLAGCVHVEGAHLTALPALEVDGKHRAIHVSLTDVPNETALVAGVERHRIDGWREAVGQAFVYALKETFVVANQPGEGILELVIMRATPNLVTRGQTGFGQIDYQAQLRTFDGVVLARAAQVAEGPQTAMAFEQIEATLSSALEEMVRQVGAKVLPSIPSDFPSSQLTGVVTWTESAMSATQRSDEAAPTTAP